MKVSRVVAFAEPKAWPEKLNRKWKVDIGLGYASPLAVGNRLFVFSRQGDNEVMSALEADSGKTVWRIAYPAPFKMNPALKVEDLPSRLRPVFAAPATMPRGQ
jgi:outer membrane protein assembly factor BamB